MLPMLSHANGARRSPQKLTVGQLEDRFASRYVSLTERERQACARAAIGMSVEATALDLEIAKTSVLTYRRRAYQRLKDHQPVRAVLVGHQLIRLLLELCASLLVPQAGSVDEVKRRPQAE
jgi:DNA-binding CsgD family transcriptional regulator